jgi:hypothetical protein
VRKRRGRFALASSKRRYSCASGFNVTTLSGLLIYLLKFLRFDRSIGYIPTLSLRSYYLRNILLLIPNLLKGSLGVFGIKKPIGFLSGSNIPRSVLYVLILLSCRLIGASFAPWGRQVCDAPELLD